MPNISDEKTRKRWNVIRNDTIRKKHIGNTLGVEVLNAETSSVKRHINNIQYFDHGK